MKYRTVQITKVDNGYLVTGVNDDGSSVTLIAVDFNQAVVLVNEKKLQVAEESRLQ